MTRHSLFLAVLVAAAACGGTDPEPLDLSGTWRGATDDGTAVTLNLSHDLSTDRLSGTWIVAFGGVSFTGTADGNLASGSVTLAMHFEGEPSLFSYTGAVTDDGTTTLRGTIRDAYGNTHPLELTKG